MGLGNAVLDLGYRVYKNEGDRIWDLEGRDLGDLCMGLLSCGFQASLALCRIPFKAMVIRLIALSRTQETKPKTLNWTLKCSKQIYFLSHKPPTCSPSSHASLTCW